MDDDREHEETKEKLLHGGIIFGITVTIAFCIVCHFGSQIEFAREGSSFWMDILLWVVEWFVILGAFAVPWVVWKKMVKPYKDF